MDWLQWICVALAIMNLWLQGNKDRRCFYIGLFANGVWAYFFYRNGFYPMLFMQSIYFVLNIRGLMKWNNA